MNIGPFTVVHCRLIVFLVCPRKWDTMPKEKRTYMAWILRRDEPTIGRHNIASDEFLIYKTERLQKFHSMRKIHLISIVFGRLESAKNIFFLPKMINSGSEWLGPIHEKCCTVKRCSALFPSVSFCSKNDIYHYEKKVFLAMKWHCRFFSSMYERNFFNNFDFWIQTKWKLATANTQCISKNIVIYPTSMYWCHCQVFTLYLFYFYSITGTNVNEMWNI